jgi:hypothetical protein
MEIKRKPKKTIVIMRNKSIDTNIKMIIVMMTTLEKNSKNNNLSKSKRAIVITHTKKMKRNKSIKVVHHLLVQVVLMEKNLHNSFQILPM